MAKRPQQEEFDRDILDIIPERYNADEEHYDEDSGSRLRTIITVIVALFAVGLIVVIGWRFLGSRHAGSAGTQVIKADDRAIKVRPDDRGGMQVPNQDKLVYGRMESEGNDGAKTERLLAPPEEPKAPPRPGALMPEAALPPPPAAPAYAPAAPVYTPPPAPVNVAPPAAPPPILSAPPVPVQTAPPPVTSPSERQPITSPPARQPITSPPARQPITSPPAAPVKAAAPPAPAPAPAPAAHKSAAESGGAFLVQLGAVRSADVADKEWSRIQHANAELLSGLKPDIVEVDIPGKGTFWRIRAGSLSEQGARQLCQQLTSRDQGCLLVHK